MGRSRAGCWRGVPGAALQVLAAVGVSNLEACEPELLIASERVLCHAWRLAPLRAATGIQGAVVLRKSLKGTVLVLR